MHEVIDRVAFDEACSPVLAPETAAPPRTRLALVGGFLPRRCGIATFTTDIHASLRLAVPDHAIDIYAMTPAVDAIDFDTSICSTITDGDETRVFAAARPIATSGADVMWLKHELRLFGGWAGEMIFAIVNRVRVSLIVQMGRMGVGE